MARVEAAALPLADEEGRPDGLERVEDFFHSGFGDGAAALAEGYEGSFGAAAAAAAADGAPRFLLASGSGLFSNGGIFFKLIFFLGSAREEMVDSRGKRNVRVYFAMVDLG